MSGTLTLTELKDEVRDALGGRTDLNDRLTRFLNLAQQRLARIHDFDEMEVTSTTSISNTAADSDKYIALPDLRELYSFRIIDPANGNNSRKLRYIFPRAWDEKIAEPENWSRDIPRLYTRWGTTLEVYPLPDATYTATIRRTKWPTAFSDSLLTATSDFTAKDEILIELAVIIAMRSLKQFEEAKERFPHLRTLLSEAVKEDRIDPDKVISSIYANPLSISSNQPWLDPFVSET